MIEMQRVIQFAIVFLSACAAHAGSTALDAVDRGQYGGAGGHVPDNLNYIVGDTSTGGTRRNFFVFDLATIDMPIVSAELRVRNNSFASPDPTETWTLFDVITPFEQLLNGDASISGYEDLGTGVVYGERVMSEADEFSFVSVTLNQNAIDALNAARLDTSETRWAVGGAFTTLDNDPNTTEATFTSTDIFPLSDTQLLITTIPAPPALALLGVAALSPRRRRTS